MATRACGAEGSAASAARPGRTPLLESQRNVVKDGQKVRVFEVTACGCDCWYCRDCCRHKGWDLRLRLMAVLQSFTGLMMLTLTVDPTLFASARDAYLYTRKQRAISRLMRELDAAGHLHTRRYFYVVEFQSRTEYAHFHVLVDATHIPKPAIDAAWSRFRPLRAGPVADNRPAFGMTRFSRSKFEGGAKHASNYATKYLIKTPEHGWPAWVLAMGKDHRLPRYQTSRGFWSNPPKPAPLTTGKPRTAMPRSYEQRIAECGTTSNLFETHERLNIETGEVERDRSWLGRVRLRADVLRTLSDRPDRWPRITVPASDTAGCLRALREAAGSPIQFVHHGRRRGGAA